MTELSISSRTSDVSTIEDSIDAVFRSNPEYSEVLDDDGWTIEYDKDSTEVLITVRHGGVVLVSIHAPLARGDGRRTVHR